MNKAQREALSQVIRYLQEDEEENYLADPGPDHVWAYCLKLLPLLEPRRKRSTAILPRPDQTSLEDNGS